jgi:predicted ATP-grasp superfamily ATP-dependent carboligase
MPRVLVTDAMERKAVPVIRALGRAGLTVIAGESTRAAMGFYSRYCAARRVYPPPEDEHAFVEWLVAAGRRGDVDVVVPVDERTMTPLTRWRERLLPWVKLPIVDHETYLTARDKARTLEAAARVGVPAPRTWRFDGPADLRARVGEVTLPAVVKPRTASGSRGLRYVETPAALEVAYAQVHERYPDPLVQERIPPGGDTYGVECLVSNGDVLAYFMHRRLREYPVDGGPSTLRESVYDKELIERAGRLLSFLGWHGVAMVEFKVDPRDGVARLMEINAKFWGSIALPILCGVNFPLLLCRMAQGAAVQAPASYPVGVRSRWLIPGDLMHFAANPERFRLQPSFFDFRGATDDLIDGDDPGPLIGMAVSLLSRARKASFWREKVLRSA